MVCSRALVERDFVLWKGVEHGLDVSQASGLFDGELLELRGDLLGCREANVEDGECVPLNSWVGARFVMVHLAYPREVSWRVYPC